MPAARRTRRWTRPAFEARRAAGGFALWWRAHGLSYGIPIAVKAELAAGRVVIASVSRAVIAEAARRYPVRVVEITAPPAVLASRLAQRRREEADGITERLARHVALPDDVDGGAGGERRQRRSRVRHACSTRSAAQAQPLRDDEALARCGLDEQAQVGDAARQRQGAREMRLGGGKPD